MALTGCSKREQYTVIQLRPFYYYNLYFMFIIMDRKSLDMSSFISVFIISTYIITQQLDNKAYTLPRSCVTSLFDVAQ